MKPISLLLACTTFLGTGTLAANVDSWQAKAVTNFFDYIGFEKGTPASREEPTEEADQPPKLKSFGLQKESFNDDQTRGFALNLNADLGLSYEFPLYNQDQYLVFRQRLHAYLGGRNYFEVAFGFVKFIIYLDVWGARLTFLDNYMRYDIVNYGDYCQVAQWFLEFAQVQTFVQIDVNECIYGLIGSVTEDTSDCEWATYFINHPLYQIDFYDESRTGKLTSNSCGEDVPNYDGATILG